VGKTITQQELRNELTAILCEVQAGDTLVVTRYGTPVAELRPPGRRHFVPRTSATEAARLAPRIDARRFRRDLDREVDPSAR
jgi:prevent-host-death family protein